MDSQPPIETVYRALYTLFENPNPDDKRQANQWLENLQKSVYAWKVADELLIRCSDLNSCYFGSQIFRNKILHSFHELPPDACNSLRDTLLHHLSNANENISPIVITQLCLAMVDLALQMGSWKCPVTDFISQCDKLPCHVSLEILQVFPEEVDRKSMRLGANRRNDIFDELEKCSESVNDFLKSIISSNPNKNIILKVIKCFSSWIPVGISSIPNIVDDDVISQILLLLSDPPDQVYQDSESIESRLHDAASDCICYILRNSRQEPNILEIKFFNRIIDLEPAYHTSVARECTEKSMNYCRIFSELAESFLPRTIQEIRTGIPCLCLKSLDAVLICVGHHDYEVAMITFPFWFYLSENLYQCNNDKLSADFRPYIERLLTSLCRQVQMEPDHEGLLDDTDDFKHFRTKVIEVVKDVIFIIGSARCFKQMFISLQTPGLTWDQIEAHLFIMTAIARNILPEENVVVPKAVTAIFELPPNTHIAVKHAAVLLLGELCEWFDKHPDHLVTALDFIVFCLQQNQLSNAAAVSLHHICCTSKTKLKDRFAPLLHIVQSLTAFSVDNEHAVEIIKGIMAVMSELPSDQITPTMKEICRLHASQIYQLIENRAEVRKGTSTDPNVWLDRIAAIFRYTIPSKNGIDNPCVPVLNDMFPVFSRILEHYQSDGRIMERCCRCIRFAVRCLGKSGSFVLEPLVKQLVTLYSNHQHSCFMYLGSILVDEYGEDSANWGILLEMVQAFIAPTFNLLKDPKCLQQHPDIIDDLFRLCSRFMQRLPIAFMQSSSLFPLLECGLVAISLDHKEANASVMKFFHEMLNFSDENEDMQKQEARKQVVSQLIEKHGETLVHNMIHASLFTLPTHMLSEISEVLFDLLELNRSVTHKWIKKAVEQLPKENSSGTITATEEQVRQFLHACETVVYVKPLTRSLKEFAYFYR